MRRPNTRAVLMSLVLPLIGFVAVAGIGQQTAIEQELALREMQVVELEATVVALENALATSAQRAEMWKEIAMEGKGWLDGAAKYGFVGCMGVVGGAMLNQVLR